MAGFSSPGFLSFPDERRKKKASPSPGRKTLPSTEEKKEVKRLLLPLRT